MIKVKPTQTRIDFERFLYKLGYRDRSPVSLERKRKSTKIARECFPISINYIEFFIFNYKNKKSFIYEKYLIDKYTLSKKDLFKKYSYLLKKIQFDKNHIGEIGWKIMWDRNPSILTKNQHKKILYRVIKEFKNIRKTKNYFTRVYPYQILVSNPWGNQLYNLNSNDDFNIARKRSKVNSKFGFGELDEYGYEYAMFDEDLYLNPI
jgi:hypothetical protein